MPELGRPDPPLQAPAFSGGLRLYHLAPPGNRGHSGRGKSALYGIAGNNVGELSGTDRRARCGRCKSIDHGHSPRSRAD